MTMVCAVMSCIKKNKKKKKIFLKIQHYINDKIKIIITIENNGELGMRVGRRKIPLKNLILISTASHFTKGMSFQIFIFWTWIFIFTQHHWIERQCWEMESGECEQKRLGMLLRDSFNTQYRTIISIFLSFALLEHVLTISFILWCENEIQNFQVFDTYECDQS